MKAFVLIQQKITSKQYRALMLLNGEVICPVNSVEGRDLNLRIVA